MHISTNLLLYHTGAVALQDNQPKERKSYQLVWFHRKSEQIYQLIHKFVRTFWGAYPLSWLSRQWDTECTMDSTKVRYRINIDNKIPPVGFWAQDGKDYVQIVMEETEKGIFTTANSNRMFRIITSIINGVCLYHQRRNRDGTLGLMDC